MRYAQLHTDILVLGAGLAGLRAAWAAREAAPRLNVTIACARPGPSGSSFANRNNALGIQTPLPHQAESFVDEVLRLAGPGVVQPDLAHILAKDAQSHLAELLALNLTFRREASGALQRFPGCFSSTASAVIFDDLAQTYRAFASKIHELGVSMLPGWTVQRLLPLGGGAVLSDAAGQGLVISAKATIVALGGPGPLFAWRTCGPGGTGTAQALLDEAGASLINTRYLQWFWIEPRRKVFHNPARCFAPGIRIRLSDGSMAETIRLLSPQDQNRMPELLAQRLGHCPAAHDRPDAILDTALLAQADSHGVVWLEAPRQGLFPLALAAHTGNGGARIDGEGRTSVPGLFACGECASGMHGANRLGGAMVLSALVFGARAGRAAAHEATGGPAPKWDLPDLIEQRGRTAGHWLRQGLQRVAALDGACCDQVERRRFISKIRTELSSVALPRSNELYLKSALAILAPK